MAGKLCWALGLVLLFAAAVLTQAPLAVGLLGFFLLLTLLLVLEVRYLRGKVEAELIVPDQPAVQGRPFVLTVRLTNHSPLPIPQLLTLVQATDEWGGNTITLRCSGMLGSKARAEQRLTLQANKSGVWQLRLQSVTLWDHLGLFKAQCGLPQTAQSLCVLPQSARLGSDTQPDPDADGMQESDRSVLGGNYDVREYREGDSLKQVHWKLSAKLNRLLIREPLAAGTMAGQGSGDGPGEGEGDMWGDFPAEAALHREAPPTKKKAVALSKRGGTDADSGPGVSGPCAHQPRRTRAGYPVAGGGPLPAAGAGLWAGVRRRDGLCRAPARLGVAGAGRVVCRVVPVWAAAPACAAVGPAGWQPCLFGGAVFVPAQLFGRGTPVWRCRSRKLK